VTEDDERWKNLALFKVWMTDKEMNSPEYARFLLIGLGVVVVGFILLLAFAR